MSLTLIEVDALPPLVDLLDSIHDLVLRESDLIVALSDILELPAEGCEELRRISVRGRRREEPTLSLTSTRLFAIHPSDFPPWGPGEGRGRVRRQVESNGVWVIPVHLPLEGGKPARLGSIPRVGRPSEAPQSSPLSLLRAPGVRDAELKQVRSQQRKKRGWIWARGGATYRSRG